jgi:murein DD-endopeptidase MepM/ murein hydrolase activator NlpD
MALEDVLYELKNVRVLDQSIPVNKYVQIDLSEKQTELSKKFLESTENFERFINNYLTVNNAVVAYGGYNEERTIYKKHELFNDDESEERNIHMGVDFWAPAGTTVLAALDGVIHSFDYNTGKGNYGPTIIVEHNYEGEKFYTLYGHLSMESIGDIEIGDPVTRGKRLAEIGTSAENGDYAPHLHFQIIRDLGDFTGDYPGVCAASERDEFLENCPDPELLFKFEMP